MNIEDFVAINGQPGLFKMIANRANGLIVEDLNNGQRKFMSSRKYQFTPLASIGIYSGIDETTELKEVFKSIKDNSAESPMVSPSASADEIRSYFKTILPDYDEDRVFIGDMKKVIKWYEFLESRDLLQELQDDTSEEE